MSIRRCLSACLQTDRTLSDREAVKRSYSAESTTLHTSVMRISYANAGLALAESKRITQSCKSESDITTEHFRTLLAKSFVCKTD